MVSGVRFGAISVHALGAAIRAANDKNQAVTLRDTRTGNTFEVRAIVLQTSLPPTVVFSDQAVRTMDDIHTNYAFNHSWEPDVIKHSTVFPDGENADTYFAKDYDGRQAQDFVLPHLDLVG
jgi:hypothetical protein